MRGTWLTKDKMKKKKKRKKEREAKRVVGALLFLQKEKKREGEWKKEEDLRLSLC